MRTPAPPVLTPRERQTGGCCTATVVPDLGREAAVDLAQVFKALADPTRLRIVDALRKAAPEALCQCELVPLFEVSQPALSRHLRLLREAGVIGCERRGTWAFYFIPEGSRARELSSWLG